MSDKIKNKYSFDRFIVKSSKNGYFNQIKAVASKDLSPQKNADSLYRFNVTSHYAQKIKKPFKLFDQPEYKR